MMEWFGWLGRITPEQRAKKEVEEIDRLLYDAQKAVHDSRATLGHLWDRREFLRAEYALDDLPPKGKDKDHISIVGESFVAARPDPGASPGARIVRNFDRREVGDGSHNLHNPHHEHGG